MTPIEQRHRQYQFYFPETDSHVLVENHAYGVVFRKSSRNFSDQNKAFFIRHLAAEGCIPDQYQQFGLWEQNEYSELQWIVDSSWLSISPALTRRADKFMCRLFIGAGSLLLMIFLLVFFQTR